MTAMEGDATTEGGEVSKTPASATTPAETNAAPAAAPASLPQEAPVPASQPKQNSSADQLFGGNAVAEAAQKKSEPAAVPIVPASPNASPRALREVGLAPRTGITAEAPTTLSSGEQGTDPQEKPRIAPIRTYAADVGEVIRKRGETLATIVGAEQEKKTETAEETKGPDRAAVLQRAILMGGAGLLVLAGGAIIAGVLLFSGPEEPEPVYLPLIAANAAVPIEAGGDTKLSELLAAERVASDINLGEVAEVVISKDGARLTPSQILTLLNAPPTIARTATDLMVGIHAFNRNQPFILIQIEAYDRAFESMLAWEPSMGEDLGAFFAPVRSISVPPPSTLTFSDRVYQNIDVRISEPSWQIVYAFPERDLLLITTNDSTLREVLTRLSLSGR